MKITLLVTGKCKEKPILSLCDEYIKRLKPYLAIQVIELPQDKSNSPAEIKRKEADAQLSKITENSIVIALDERGEIPSTRQLAQKISHFQNQGTSHITFIIGGAEGLDENIRKRADYVLSLSKLTFPHMMVRPIILEQIYRVMMVLNNHPYHRD